MTSRKPQRRRRFVKSFQNAAPATSANPVRKSQGSVALTARFTDGALMLVMRVPENTARSVFWKCLQQLAHFHFAVGRGERIATAVGSDLEVEI